MKIHSSFRTVRFFLGRLFHWFVFVVRSECVCWCDRTVSVHFGVFIDSRNYRHVINVAALKCLRRIQQYIWWPVGKYFCGRSNFAQQYLHWLNLQQYNCIYLLWHSFGWYWSRCLRQRLLCLRVTQFLSHLQSNMIINLTSTYLVLFTYYF